MVAHFRKSLGIVLVSLLTTGAALGQQNRPQPVYEDPRERVYSLSTSICDESSGGDTCGSDGDGGVNLGTGELQPLGESLLLHLTATADFEGDAADWCQVFIQKDARSVGSDDVALIRLTRSNPTVQIDLDRRPANESEPLEFSVAVGSFTESYQNISIDFSCDVDITAALLGKSLASSGPGIPTFPGGTVP